MTRRAQLLSTLARLALEQAEALGELARLEGAEQAPAPPRSSPRRIRHVPPPCEDLPVSATAAARADKQVRQLGGRR